MEDGQTVREKEEIAVDKQFQVQFSFLSLDNKNKSSYQLIDFNSVKEFGTDVEKQAITARNNVDIWIKLSH